MGKSFESEPCAAALYGLLGDTVEHIFPIDPRLQPTPLSIPHLEQRWIAASLEALKEEFIAISKHTV